MPNAGVGFFGKLPGVGDFVLRRLPRQFVETWDQHFEHAVGTARRALGGAWHDTFQRSPVWRFLLAPDVCTASAWVGVMGPATDRVGRTFPMVLVAPLAAEPSAGGRVLRHADGWFDALERVQRAGQADGAMGVDAFDALVAALPDPLSGCAGDALEWVAGLGDDITTPWCAELPRRGTDSAALAAWWARTFELGDGRCIWWTLGAERVPPRVLLMQGLPAPELYAGLLDASQAIGGWREPGSGDPVAPRVPRAAPMRGETMRRPSPDAETTASQPLLVHPAMASGPGTRGSSADDLSGLLGGSADPFAAAGPGRAGARSVSVPVAGDLGGGAVLYRHDCELTLVSADEGAFDANRRAAAAARSIANDMETGEFGVGMQVLRDRLLAIHWQLRQAGAGQIVPVAEDGAIVAVRVQGSHAAALRIGAANAWHWRRGQLRPLFAPVPASAPAPDQGASGGDLDDLLFAHPPSAPGLGAESQAQCDEVVCAVERGDRLLLAATRRLVELPAAALAAALTAGSCGDARIHIARAAGLGPAPDQWPLAVIEVTA